MPSDHLLELFLDLKWSPEKIRNETARIYRDIGGRENESAFVSSVRHASSDPKVLDAFAYTLAEFKRNVGKSKGVTWPKLRDGE